MYMMACTLGRVHTDNQPVKIQDYLDSSTYWLIPDQKEPPGNKIDRLLTERIRKTSHRPNDFFPNEEQMVAVMNTTTNVWQRGKIKTIFQAEHNHTYSVFLVDYGIKSKVAHDLVRELPPDEIFQKEHHATQFKLYGVVPCEKRVACLQDFKLFSVSGKDWDPFVKQFIDEQVKAATAIYMSPMKGVELCDGDVIQGDLHFVIDGQCISLIDNLCRNQFAVFDEVLFKKKCGVLQDEESKLQTAYTRMKSEILPAVCSDGPIAIPLCTSLGRGKLNLTNASMNTVVKSSWASSNKEPVYFPGGMNISSMNSLTPKTGRSPTTGHTDKSFHGTNNPNITRRSTGPAPTLNTSQLPTHNITTQQNASSSQSSTVVESVKYVTDEQPTQVANRSSSEVYGSTSPCSNDTESSQVVNVSPKATSQAPEQMYNVSPVSPDSAQQCVTARGRRFQALLKDLETTKKKGNANESLEEASFNSTLDSVNTSGTGSSCSGLFNQIKTAFDRSKNESNDSNCGFTPVNSPCCPTDKSPSSTPSSNVARNKFLSLLDDLL